MHDFLTSDLDVGRVIGLPELAERAAADAAARFPELAPILDVVEHELNALSEATTTPEGDELPRAYHQTIERMAEMLANVRCILAEHRAAGTLAGIPSPTTARRPASVARP